MYFFVASEQDSVNFSLFYSAVVPYKAGFTPQAWVVREPHWHDAFGFESIFFFWAVHAELKWQHTFDAQNK